MNTTTVDRGYSASIGMAEYPGECPNCGMGGLFLVPWCDCTKGPAVYKCPFCKMEFNDLVTG